MSGRIGEAMQAGPPPEAAGASEIDAARYRRFVARWAAEVRQLLEAPVELLAQLIAAPAAEQVLAATTKIQATGLTVRLSAAAPVTIAAAPTIPDGEDGQYVCLTNVGSNAITVQDQGTLASSNLRLTANTLALAARQSLWLRYDAGIGDWLQVVGLVAVL